jgi:hypothetical protein
MTKCTSTAAIRTGLLVACLAVVVFVSALSFGQQMTGTLTGTTTDSTGAVVPDAKVTLKNELSGDLRTTASNGAGYFSITAIQPGSYTVTVSAPGFKNWSQAGIVFAQGDTRTMPQIALQVGATSETVEITGDQLVVPMENAEISTTLNQNVIANVPYVGRDAGELIKLLPGAVSTNGLKQGSSFTDKVVQSNSGPVGAFSINGTQPNGAMAFMLDGANLVDPGNMGTQIANINPDMISEVKFLTSSYTAEYAKGPVLFQAFSKSGGAQFHGEGYLYARNSALNSIDAYTKSQVASGATTAAKAAPDESFYYMGGNVGGPIHIPGTGFNKNRDKLFFWVGYEYMRQHPAGQIINYNTFTMAQLGLDSAANTKFCPQLANGCGVTNPFVTETDPNTNQAVSGGDIPAGAVSNWGYSYGNPYNPPAGTYQTDFNGNPCGGTGQLPCSASVVPVDSFDPNILGLRAIYPTPNLTPNSGNNWSNFQYVSNFPNNRWEITGKVDYAINENSKIAFSYARQPETLQHPVSIWWVPQWTIPYPSGVSAKQLSQMYMANFTHTFNPTTTNEFVFTMAKYINPNQLTQPSKVDRSTYGFNVPGLFGHTSKQIPNMVTDSTWYTGFPDIQNFSFDGSFNGGNTFGGLKKVPAIFDNFTKVLGAHTIKTGFYWDTQHNIQSSSNYDQGVYNYGWGNQSTGNIVDDFLAGRILSYTQSSAVPVDDLKYHQLSFYVQDSFKANRQLTLTYGIRLDHMGQWYGVKNGIQVWNPATYTNTPAVYDQNGNCTANCNPGLSWHANNSSIPLSGFVSPTVYYEPRVGLAYDVFGNGKTVLRAGYAVYHYQISTEVCNNGACDGPLGTVNYVTPTYFSGYAIPSSFIPPSGGVQNGSSVGVSQMGDNKVPLTTDWNVTISQALPWRSVFEVSYVANKTQNIFVNGSNSNLFNANNIATGRMWGIDPVTGINMTPNTPSCSGVSVNNNPPPAYNIDSSSNDPSLYCANQPALYLPSASFNANDFRPLSNYQNIYVHNHMGYANYNSLQMAWQKQSGPVSFQLNYVFSKVLGTRDWNSDNGVSDGQANDPFSLANNYGVLSFDHTQTVNATYLWRLPKAFNGKRLMSSLLDGWELSGYTTYSMGAPIQPNSGDLNVTYPTLTVPTVQHPSLPDYSVVMPNGLRSVGVNTSTWLGTNAYNHLSPMLVCDPRKHASGLYFNPNCFAPPAYGTSGPNIWPYIRNPAYFDSDLALFKNFQITERQKVQFRISAVNFLNHPLPQFGADGGTNDYKISFDQKVTQQVLNAVKSTPGNPVYDAVDIHSLAQTNQNTTTTGKPKYEVGQRTLMFTLKYFF